jgi:hypothetical protein
VHADEAALEADTSLPAAFDSISWRHAHGSRQSRPSYRPRPVLGSCGDRVWKRRPWGCPSLQRIPRRDSDTVPILSAYAPRPRPPAGLRRPRRTCFVAEIAAQQRHRLAREGDGAAGSALLLPALRGLHPVASGGAGNGPCGRQLRNRLVEDRVILAMADRGMRHDEDLADLHEGRKHVGAAVVAWLTRSCPSPSGRPFPAVQ